MAAPKKKAKDLMAQVTGDVIGAAEKAKARRSTAQVIPAREHPGLGNNNPLAEITSGKAVEKTMHWVDPARCRLWRHHNRRYELLDEHNCADLIEGIKKQGQQEFPAIVRRLKADPTYDYEIICGARRHWAITWLREHNYPRFEYLIEVRDLTDEEAFRLSDAENRDRQDISDYERAVDYQNALASFYDGHQGQMAERLQVSDAWLSRYLDLARLPKEIVKSYNRPMDLKIQHARELKPLLKDAENKRHILSAARDLTRAQAEAQREGRAPLDGSTVLVRLKAAVNSHRPARTPPRSLHKEYYTKSGETMMTASRKGNIGMVLRLLPKVEATKAELLKACEAAIDEHLG